MTAICFILCCFFYFKKFLFCPIFLLYFSTQVLILLTNIVHNSLCLELLSSTEMFSIKASMAGQHGVTARIKTFWHQVKSNQAKLFPQYAKSSKNSSTKIPKKIKSVSQVMQNSNTTGMFYYISNSVFKGNCHLCWSTESMLSFVAYEGKQFAKNWIGTLPPLCSKTGDVANT